MQIVARTDARAAEGIDAAIERARRYVEAGADMTFVEAPRSSERPPILKPLEVPQIPNMVVGGKTPNPEHETPAQIGFSIVLYANAALQGAIVGMQRALSTLRERGALEEAGGLLAKLRRTPASA